MAKRRNMTSWRTTNEDDQRKRVSFFEFIHSQWHVLMVSQSQTHKRGTASSLLNSPQEPTTLHVPSSLHSIVPPGPITPGRQAKAHRVGCLFSGPVREHTGSAAPGGRGGKPQYLTAKKRDKTKSKQEHAWIIQSCSNCEILASAARSWPSLPLFFPTNLCIHQSRPICRRYCIRECPLVHIPKHICTHKKIQKSMDTARGWSGR